MAKIYCSNCGQLINDTSNFCHYCGAPQKGKESAVFRVEQPTIDIKESIVPPSVIEPVTDFEQLDRQHLGSMAIMYFFLQNLRYSFIILILLAIGIVFDWKLFAPVIIVYFLFCFVLANLKYNNYRYSLTESFLLLEWGIITKKQVSIPYVQIENVNIKRSILDIILGLSQINIETAGGEEVTHKGNSAYFSEGDIPAISLPMAKKLHDILLETAQKFQQNG